MVVPPAPCARCPLPSALPSGVTSPHAISSEVTFRRLYTRRFTVGAVLSSRSVDVCSVHAVRSVGLRFRSGRGRPSRSPRQRSPGHQARAPSGLSRRARSRSAISATSGWPARTDERPVRLTDNTRARDLSALLARRPLDRVLLESLRQQRRVRRPGGRRHAAAADVLLRQRRCRRLVARLAAGRCSARRTATARSRTSRRCIRCRSAAARRSRCRSTGATGAASRPTASRSCSTAIPRCGRASTIAEATRPTCGSPISAQKTYTKLLPDERYNRYWPMWGADDDIYFVADPLPNDKDVEPGSLEVRKSANNIYKVPVGGGQPVQVTQAHRRQSVLAVDVERRQGDRLRRELRHLEAGRRVGPDERDQDRHRRPTKRKTSSKSRRCTNEVDAFDLSPSGRRAVISARGQILTIATDRGDITRVAPDTMASRNQSPKWSPDGKYIAFVSDNPAATRSGSAIPKGKSPKKITNLDNEKGALRLVAGLEDAALHGRRQEAVQLHASPTRRRRVVTSDTSAASASVVGLARQQVGGVLEAGPHAALARLHRADRRRRRASHLGRSTALLREQRRLDRRRPLLVFTSSEGFSNGIATQGGISTTMELWALSLRDQDRDPTEPRHRQRGAGPGGRGGGRQRRPRRRWRRRAGAECRSTGTTSRAARGRSPCPGTTIGGLTRRRRAVGRADGRRPPAAAAAAARPRRRRRHVHRQRRERTS